MIKKFFITATFFLIPFSSNSLAFSQDIKGIIRLYSESKNKILVSLTIENDRLIDENISFLRDYADAENLGSRVSGLSLAYDKYNDGKSIQRISHRKFTDGEYVAAGKFNKINYTVDLKALKNTLANAHVSWIGETQGLLMLNDILPKLKGENVTAHVNFQMPQNWKIKTDSQSVISKIATGEDFPDNRFLVNNPEDAIFFIGENWREKEILVNESKLNFLISDKWQFSDDLAFEMAKEITREYAELFGEMPAKKAQIFLINFPKPMERGRWRAETRGANITILSSQAYAKSFAKQRLHEQLRHEIFHLWIPNSLSLSGDYAWFYEGFALYQSLKTGVNLGRIRFEDFLNTLEQAKFLDQKRRNKNSLIDISKMRWNGEIGSVYAKGMLVAFLCDAAILKKSKGKRDLKNVFREIYRNYRNLSEKRDANESILNVLKKQEEMQSIINLYIEGSDKIVWTKSLASFGIENIGTEINADLRVRSKLSGRQKALLKKLGYNRRRNFNRRKINKN